MKIYLLDPLEIRNDADELHRGSYLELLASAKSNSGVYKLSDNLQDADLIIACISAIGYGPFLEKLRNHRIYQDYRGKIFVYSMDDNQYPSIPGVYPALNPAFHEMGWARGGHYFSTFITKHDFDGINVDDRDILFSFIGSSKNHPIREQILYLNHPRAFLQDSSSPDLKHWWDEKPEKRKNLIETFADVTPRSKFCLCPRGVSASSIRLFEAMQAGCVPVIIADDLVLPGGPNWSSFSVQVLEKDVQHIPLILEDLEDKTTYMGDIARKNWEKYFSSASTFETLVSTVVDLQKVLGRRETKGIRVSLGELTPKNMRIRLRTKYHQIRSQMKVS
jgi:Exostosin family